MDKNLAYINDFINIETQINNEYYGTSLYTGVEDFFLNHLKDTDSEKIKLESISVFEQILKLKGKCLLAHYYSYTKRCESY